MGVNYYNENDPYAAAWLRNLIAAGHIAPGVVDEQSIADVGASDLRPYTQCHFFAGIGGWSLALRLAGWPDDRPVWTGSCPCQPFSAAGKGLGEKDPRHLWPEFRRLIAECHPASVFGEQVASAAGREWLSGVRADLEELAYAVGAADLCAASAGAPHIRQRLWWVADNLRERREVACESHSGSGQSEFETSRRIDVDRCSALDGLADAGRGSAQHDRCELAGTSGGVQSEAWQQRIRSDAGGGGDVSGLEHTSSNGRQQRRAESVGRSTEPRCSDSGLGDASGTRLEVGINDGRIQRSTVGTHAWQATECASYVDCADGKARRIEPSIQPLAHGIPNCVGRLRAYGNAIVPQVAAEFIGAFCDAR